VREVADKARIEAFLTGSPAKQRATLMSSSSAAHRRCWWGWRPSTVDINLVMRPESDAMLRAIPTLKERLQVNVELASPDQFIPVPPGWEARSPVINRIGSVTFRHYDFCAQALAKIERGHDRDLADVQAMVDRGLIDGAQVRAMFARMEPELFRFPSIDPPSFRRAVDELFPP
jgi:hypothetical protein